MSADAINQQAELPVWVIHGVNWHCEVGLDESNAQFEPEMQAYEAATQALMVFKGKSNKFFLVVTEGEEVPYLGPTMIAHLKGTDPHKGFLPLTHVVLANGGFYKESREMEVTLNKELEAIKQDQIKNEDAQRRLDEHKRDK